MIETQVLVIGGGATGTAVARDAALRGMDVVLVERKDLAEGTTGRFHGLLHSGGRYVVKDPISAKECMDERVILGHIAGNSVEDTGGLFVSPPGDDEAYCDEFVEGCHTAGIPVEGFRWPRRCGVSRCCIPAPSARSPCPTPPSTDGEWCGAAHTTWSAAAARC